VKQVDVTPVDEMTWRLLRRRRKTEKNEKIRFRWLLYTLYFDEEGSVIGPPAIGAGVSYGWFTNMRSLL
jgi:hypothetical protein